MVGNYTYSNTLESTTDPSKPLIGTYISNLSTSNGLEPVVGSYYWTQLGLDIGGTQNDEYLVIWWPLMIPVIQ